MTPLLFDFQWILGSAAPATAIGAFLVPSAQRAFVRAVALLQVHRSLFAVLRHAVDLPRRLLLRAAFRGAAACQSLVLARAGRAFVGISRAQYGSGGAVDGGVFASLYAGALEPALGVTCSNLSSIINGVATIIMFLLLDPQLSLLTDDVAHRRVGQGTFRSAVASLIGSPAGRGDAGAVDFCCRRRW